MLQVVFPQIRSGVYRIGSAARLDPHLYLERQVDGSISAVEKNVPFNAQFWSITPVEDGMYTISCVRDDSPIKAMVSAGQKYGVRETSLLWSIEARGNTFVIGSSSGSLALGIDEYDQVKPFERRNVREQRWLLHLINYNDIPIRSSASKESVLLSPYKRDSTLSAYDNAIPSSDCIHLMRRIHQMTNAYLNPPSRPSSPVGTRASSEFEGYDQHPITGAVQADPDTETLAQRLQEKDDEIQKLKSNLEILTQRLNEKDKEIANLQGNTKRTVFGLETLIQRLRTIDDELTKLQDSQSVRQGLRKGFSSRPKEEEIMKLKEGVMHTSSEMELLIQPLKRECVFLFQGHHKAACSVRFSPDGQRIVSGGRDGTIRVWDVHSGKEILALRAHEGSVFSVAFSPDNARIASGGDDKAVNVWNAYVKKRILGPLIGHGDRIWAVQFSPDGSSIVSGSRDGTICVWDSVSGAKILGPWIHQGGVFSVSFSPDGSRLTSGGDGNNLCVWDVKSGRLVLGPLMHPNRVRAVAYSHDGLQIVTGCRDGQVRLLSANSGRPLLPPMLGEPPFSIRSVGFSPDGERIVSSGEGEAIHVWNARTGAQLAGTPRNHGCWVYSVEFSPNGEWIASSGDDGTIRLWPGK